MKIGCYTLDLYCDAAHSDVDLLNAPAQFTGETRSECERAARRAGWKLPSGWGSDKPVLCPAHAKAAPELLRALVTLLGE